MPWTPLNFSPYEGKTLPQVLFKDPDFFFWAHEKGIFGQYGDDLKREAERIHAKSTSIRIPQAGPNRLLVEYRFRYGGGTFVGFDLVPEDRPPHEGSTPTFRASHIDMSVPRGQKGYDKQGYRMFLRSLKHWLFGDAGVRMTRQRCEEFFDDESNFLRNG